MKKLKIGGAVAAVFLALSSWASSLEVTDVKIAQRYPWNGLVDITYTVKSDNPDAEVFVYPIGYDADTATKVAINPQYLSGEGVNGGVRPGTRRMTWDMARQMGKNYNRAAFSVSFIAYCDAKPYMVVDLSEGSSAKNYPISYLSSIPDGGWTDEYKTTKMLFRLIPPGQIDGWWVVKEPFYFAVWPLSTQQYALIKGGTGTSEVKAGLSYDVIRGSTLGARYPEHQQADAGSIVGRLRLRTGITFDLATCCQWQAAASAYTTSASEVATLPNPNQFGIYQLGQFCEWSRDGYGSSYRYMCGLAWRRSLSGSSWSGNYYSISSLPQEQYVTLEGTRYYNDYWHQTSSMDGGIYRAYDKLYTPSYTGMDTTSYGHGIHIENATKTRPACRLVALPNCK